MMNLRAVVRRFGRVASNAALLLILGMAEACSSTCSEPHRHTVISGGRTDPVSMTYESAPWSGPLTLFRPFETLDFEHELGVAPVSVASWVSFTEGGTSDSNVSENVGDQGLIDCVDDQIVRMMNNTCETFYLRVVATSGGASTDPVQPCPALAE